MVRSLIKVKYWSLAIFSIAFLIRIISVLQITGIPFFNHLSLDPAYYNNWALDIFHGDWISSRAFDLSPLYPYFLAIIYRVFGYSLYAARLIQMLIGSLSCVLILWIGSYVFKRNLEPFTLEQ